MKNKTLVILLVILVVFLTFCSCLACGATAFGLWTWLGAGDFSPNSQVDVEVIPAPGLAATQSSQDNQSFSGDPATLDTLLNADVPINDPVDIAQRLEGKENVPLTLPVAILDLPVGTQKDFWVTDTDTAENFQIEATLSAVTDHLYFWIENGVEYSQSALDRLAADFENNIYPTNREFFGSEWFPGVDEDPHLYVIYARGLGFNLAGYYASIDEYHPDVHEFSNAHETFMLSADNAGLRDEYTYGVLAHEFQHLRQGDIEWEILLEALKPIFFLNPAFHAWKRQVEKLRELSCDSQVLTRGRIGVCDYWIFKVKRKATVKSCKYY